MIFLFKQRLCIKINFYDNSHALDFYDYERNKIIEINPFLFLLNQISHFLHIFLRSQILNFGLYETSQIQLVIVARLFGPYRMLCFQCPWFKILYGYLFNFSPLCVCTRGFSPVWVLKCLLTLLARENVEPHLLHLFDFSPLCVFKCALKLLAWEDMYSLFYTV